ncbi:MAG: TetR/AcrR family transcriptional regulator [Anaerolineaceae bacterium]
MYENFERIPQAEQQHILNACIEEFAQKGYEQASTNAIVQQAGIPKGTLFFFFGNKKDLYLYVIDHVVTLYAMTALQTPGELPDDLFERLIYLGQERMKFALSQPQLYKLFFNAFINAPEDIQAELRKRYAAYYTPSMQMLTAGLDRSRFKPEVDVDKLIELIYLILEGILSKSVPALQQLKPAEALGIVEKLFVECDDYFAMIRQGVHHEGIPAVPANKK